ncbi:M15 family metallopeptidase [Clostridium oryzae]|uniref:D-alanyl-D-alanine dipeptidase n=1 Tax=Clostridium oryzae TaxID=1450648 RepID=A0A1V4IF68_9CLOT|nr:M15 family metallopeptidase [Clostridium oryzae]OPJ58167.1 D-alanyl-D-alanine dipeptidase [Clostridium oryzae]
MKTTDDFISSPSTQSTKDLVVLTSLDNDFILDLRYATDNNFTSQKIYPSDICILRKNTALKLIKAKNKLRTLGYKIKIWDAYRPLYVQKIFWDIVQNEDFIANPYKNGSIHNRGCAVDLTLTDKNFNEIVMPSSFDDFTEKAHRENPHMSKEARKNLQLLTDIMLESGFYSLDTEWWHYVDSDYKNYNLENISLELFA